MQHRVAHITTVPLALEKLLLEQMQSIQRAGYEVVGVSSPGEEAQSLRRAGIRHVPIRMSRRISPLRDLAALWRLFRLMRREKFTVVHTHTPKAGLLGQLAAKMAGVPVVVNTIHGFFFHEHMRPAKQRFYVLMERIAALCSDCILSQNKEDVQAAIDRRICPPRKIKHLGNGIDVSCFDASRFSPATIQQRRAELGLPEGAPVVGFVGRLAAKRKGFLDFLAAGQRIIERRPRTRFLVIGAADHGRPDSVEPAAANDYGLAEHCLFLGQRPSDELPGLYAVMDVLVLPSLFEGVPRAVMEASAMSVPAVVTDVRGNREAVDHDQNGLLVPLGDVAALAGAILDLLGDPEKARRMGAGGRRIALARFDEQHVFQRIIDQYADLLRGKGLEPPLPGTPVRGAPAAGTAGPTRLP